MGNASVLEATMDIDTPAPALDDEGPAPALNTEVERPPTDHIIVLVGKEQKKYSIPCDKLVSRVPYLSKSSAASSISLSYASPEDFEVVLKWIYDDMLPPLMLTHPEEYNNGVYPISLLVLDNLTSEDMLIQGQRLPTLAWNPYKVYTLSEKLHIPFLPDLIINSLRHLTSSSGLSLSPTEISSYYRACICKTKGLGQYLIELLAIAYIGQPRDHTSPSRGGTDYFKIWSELKYLDNEELVDNIIKYMREREVLGFRLADPRWGRDCRFHKHWPTRKCPSGRENVVIMRP